MRVRGEIQLGEDDGDLVSLVENTFLKFARNLQRVARRPWALKFTGRGHWRRIGTGSRFGRVGREGLRTGRDLFELAGGIERRRRCRGR